MSDDWIKQAHEALNQIEYALQPILFSLATARHALNVMRAEQQTEALDKSQQHD